MHSKKLPSDLRARVHEYYNIQYAEGKVFDEAKIMTELTPSLRQDIMRYKARDLFKQVPALNRSPVGFTTGLAIIIKPTVAFEGEIIMREGTSGDHIYFIGTGIIEILTRASTKTYAAIGDGCYFGDVAVLCRCRRTATARAKARTILHQAQGAAFRRLVGDYPEVAQYMNTIAERRQKRVERVHEVTSGSDDDELPEEDLHDEEDLKTELFTNMSVLIKQKSSKAARLMAMM
jgi:CRP-like cAMP-binding protein